MPVYTYKGVTTAGENTRGSINADNLRGARAKMREDGVFLTEIVEGGATPAKDAPSKSGLRMRVQMPNFRRVPPMERSVATRQLATLVLADVPLLDSLTALVLQIENARLKEVMSVVRERVNEGSTLADAFEQSGQFDNLYVSMIRAGEESGALGVVLGRVSDYLESSIRLRSKVTSILVYPAVMLLFSLLVVAALVTVVLPQLTSLLLSLNQPLPFYTMWIIEASDFARNWWWAMLIVAALFVMGFRFVIQTERGRLTYDSLRLRLPVIGRVTRIISIARFTRTLSTLLGSGVGIVRALDISQHVANNVIMGAAIASARTSITEGATLAAPLKASGEFPPLVTTMVEVGERSGELEAMLAKVATTYDEQVESAITRLTALLEPLLILLMVGIVLVIILATLTPLMQITSSLN
jgi:general secretion pathway protein F